MKPFIKRPLVRLAKHLSLWQQVVHQQTLLEMARQRLLVASGLMLVGFLVIMGRLVDVMALRSHSPISHTSIVHQLDIPRSDIIDRNGEVLATHIITASVYANPKVILNPREAADKLAKVLPDVGSETLYQRLCSQKGFVWLARHIPPKLQHEINKMGIPGIYLQKDYRRVYPYGRMTSHILGYCGIDNKGLSGVEKFFDIKLHNDKTPLKLSIDIRVQHIVHDELVNAVDTFQAMAANAMVMDIKTGEILAMVSIPNFDPNLPNQNKPEDSFNRNTLGVYECGSVFKVLNITIALESHTATHASCYDATQPVRIGRFKITDFKGQNRQLTLAEAFVYSSNIAAIKIAQQFGMETQKKFFEKLGLFKPATVEIPEIGHPFIPNPWTPVTTMSAAYGYGIAVSPLQIFTAISTVINEGYKIQPTLLLQEEVPPAREEVKILSTKTSKMILDLMRTAVRDGTAKQANVAGYLVFGKTGTAYRAKGRHGYGNNKTRTNSFIGGFPYHKPRYMVMVTLEDPKALPSTYGYATAGWNAAPTAGKMIARMAPILGVQPIHDEQEIKEPVVPGWVSVKNTTEPNQ